MPNDLDTLRDLARQYAEVAALPVQDEKRRLWRAHNSLKPTRVPLIAQAGRWSKWCMHYWRDEQMTCEDPFLCECERTLRIGLFNFETGDDTIQEPWFTLGAIQERGWGRVWGVTEEQTHSETADGAWKYKPPLVEWSDMAKLSPPPHRIDEAATARQADRLRGIFGDLLPVNVERGPVCSGFLADIATSLAHLRGLEQIMIDMYESPDELHRLLAFLRDGILANQTAAEAAGDYSLTSQHNQEMCYAEELEAPAANSGPRKRRELWGYCAAQEYTLISPEMHDEFMFRYQQPICEAFGLVAYGCCENLTDKIAMLRRLSNLRVIAVSPWANLVRCAEKIGTDYVYSWRPNPTDMVCSAWDEGRIRRQLREGLSAAQGCRVHIHLKDTETLQGEPDRLARWVRIAREVAEAV